MKTSLYFEAPPDLSVGRVRIANEAGEIASWVATPDDRRFEIENANPGFYVVEISPAGVEPQSVIFEVKGNVANTVTMPSFSVLSATGSDTTFLEVTDKQLAVDELYGAKKELLPERNYLPLTKVLTETSPSLVPAELRKKRLSVGLSQEIASKRESWGLFLGHTSLELIGQRIHIEVEGPLNWSPLSGERVRLSIAIEGVRVERLLLPMYRGGTTISLTPSPLSTSDVELRITPTDPKLRALLRALHAGTSEDAKAVHNQLLESHDLDVMFAKDAGDPWGAMISWLLYIRFPDVFGELQSSRTEQLIDLAPWAYDAHVIHARQLLFNSGSFPENRASAAAAALRSLAIAQVQGSPYYNYTNEIFGEMIEALCDFEGLPPPAFEKAKKIRQRWRREHPLQSSAGASFSWLRRDQAMLKKGLLAPDRHASGLLRGRDSTLVVEGKIGAGQISIEAPSARAPKSEENAWQESPFTRINLFDVFQDSSPEIDGFPDSSPEISAPMHWPVEPSSSDPNKGRFGGKSTDDGFTLHARFDRTISRKWVVVTLFVEADINVQLDHGDAVWFSLHPTFQPQWVKVMFRGRRATLVARAWGGFTVGALLPTRKVELECDLADLPDAPQIIKEF